MYCLYCGVIVSVNNPSSIYDYFQSKHVNIRGNVNSNNISIYDHDRGCHVSGNISGLYDYGNKAHINLQLNCSQFQVYDYDSKKHYLWNVNGRSISIYDYEYSKHYNYSF
jgi:hypothetical protein